jgi:rubrerythrin
VPRSTSSTVAPLRQRNDARCRHLLERSALLDVDDLAWDRVGAVELSQATIDTLVYMRDVEGFTPSYLVGVGAHPTTLADPLVAAFLDVWQAEEPAHAAAIERYLRTYAAARGIEVPAQQAAPAPRVPVLERVLGHLGGPVGRVVAAAHMTWGAANELLTMNGYRLLAQESDDPVLAELLTRIAAQESRHYSFYLLQAEWRLAASPLARAAVTRLLGGSWTPVGVGDGYKTAEEFRAVLRHLIALPGSSSVVARMDARVAALPGLARLRIYARATALPAA